MSASKLPLHNEPPELLHGDEHEHRVASAAGVVRQEPIPQREHALALGHGGDGLHGAAVGQHPTGIGALEGHAVLGRLEGHGDDGVDQPGAHRRAELRGNPCGHPERPVGRLELVIRPHLARPNQHGAVDEGHAASPERRHALLAGNPHSGVQHALVVAALRRGQRVVVGHPHQGHLSRARDGGRGGAGGQPDDQPGEQICGAVLRHDVSEHLEEPKPAGGVEDLPGNPRAQPVVEGQHALLLHHGLRELPKRDPLQRAVRAHVHQVHPHSDRVGGVDDDPGNDPSHSGCGELHEGGHLLRRGGRRGGGRGLGRCGGGGSSHLGVRGEKEKGRGKTGDKGGKGGRVRERVFDRSR
eukprot:RCo041535